MAAAEAVGLIAGLFAMSYQDIRERKLSLILIIISSVWVALMHFAFRRIELFEMLGGAVAGGVLILLSLCTRGRIGLGDALLFALVIGPCFGFFRSFGILWMALLAVTAAGVVMKLLKKEKTELPFVPFVTGAVIFELILTGGA